jgi:hypothetical protein
MLKMPGSPPGALVALAVAIVLSIAACQTEPPPATSASGAAGAATGGGASDAGGPLEDAGAAGLRAGLQANGSIAYTRNK